MLKGVLFDLGSTLQEFRREDWDRIVTELNIALYHFLVEERGHAGQLPPLDAFLEIVNRGVGTHRARSSGTMRSHAMLDVLEEVFGEHGIVDTRPDECLLPWYRGLEELVYVEPDVEPTLRRLREGGLKLGLVSNTGWPAAAHDPDLERFGIKELLECRLYSCEVGWEKPAPQIFEAALECIGLRPEEVAFVGDFLRYDVAGAQGVGMKGIWKRVQGRPPEADDHTVIPDATITRISDLPPVLADLYGWRR